MVFKLKKVVKFFVSLSIAIVLSLGLLACDGGEFDKNQTFHEITDKCILDIPYENKDFVKDGIGKAKLTRISDGDTASFVLDSGLYVTIRFYGIDTPESTGEVDKWGVSASLFTKSLISADSEFVLESSTGKAAEKDSYGTRYLGYVWYRNSADEQFKNLNLQIVENGYTKSTIQNSPQYEYYPYFKKAETFAKEKELHIWSDDEDPNYSDAALSITLKELIENQDLYWNIDSQTGSKIRLEVIIEDCVISETGTHTFVASQIIDGVVYRYSVYTGYASSAASSYLKIGNKYDITGFVQNYNENYQISGLTYVLGSSGEGYVSRVEKSSYITFDSGIKYIPRYEANLKTDATVKNATLNGTTLNLTVEAKTFIKDGISEEAEEYVITVEVESTFDVNTVLNKTMTGSVYKNSTGYFALNIDNLLFK